MTEKPIIERKKLPERRNRDAWSELTSLTDARIALGRVGASMPTEEVLHFSYAHAKARDAVHAQFDTAQLEDGLQQLGLASFHVRSAAASRNIYLRRPDLGRRLHEEDRAALANADHQQADIAFVIADGLSATAVHANAVAFMENLLPLLRKAGFSIGPAVTAHNARVAIGDEIGAIIKARLVIVLIGERPGLSAADSLGAYLTYDPREGRNDAERNCISNIRSAGLVPALAAGKAFWLVREALRQGLTGVNLKENDDSNLLNAGGNNRLEQGSPDVA